MLFFPIDEVADSTPNVSPPAARKVFSSLVDCSHSVQLSQLDPVADAGAGWAAARIVQMLSLMIMVIALTMVGS